MVSRVRQIPDYHRLCELSRRLPALDPDAVLACATIHAVGVEVQAALEASLAKHDMSEGRLRVLVLLLDQDQPIPHSELADLSCVTKGTITGLVDSLERDGYVERQPDQDDRRVVKIALTRAGRAVIDRILPGHLTRLSKMMRRLTKREQKSLIDLLTKVHDGLPALRE